MLRAKPDTGTAHTPGPWHVDLDDGRFIVRDSNDDVVADCWNGTIGDDGETALDTCEPNARLVAAAPDLLEVLEALLDGPFALEAVNRLRARDVIARARGRAATAKAEGRQP